MKLFTLLNEELKQDPAGTFAPYYFRYLGYRENIAARPATFRANGVHALFALPKPVILKNELFAGNTKCLFCSEDPMFLQWAEEKVAFFSGRDFHTNFDHYSPNYRHTVTVGLPGLIAEADASLEAHREDPEKTEMLQAMRHVLCGFRQMILNYIAAAENCKLDPEYDVDRLNFIIENCTVIANGKPQTFAQALQLIWFCHNAFLLEDRYAMALGRLDQYLYPFYKADIEAGRITDEQVIEYLENVFIRLQDDVVNICIGGQNMKGECEANALSRCILWAVHNCHVPGPNLSFRVTENTPDQLLDEALQVLGTGLGYPALMNDDINIAALRRFGYREEDIYDYSMVGCIENFITGKQPAWSDTGMQIPPFIDYVFNRGVSVTNKSFGIDTGDVADIHSMEEFMAAFEKQLSYGVDACYASFMRINDCINQSYFPDPFLSCFCDDCIGRGLDINNGGALYPSVHGPGLVGLGTTVDSLAAIEKVIFIDKAATLSELRDAMNADFVGYEALQQKLIAAPKYGNNDDFVDKYAVWYVDYLTSCFAKYKTRDGGGIYNAVGSNTAHVRGGRSTNATPDGRKRGTAISDSAAPSHGKDTRGSTATMNSLSKPDYTKLAVGSVINQKYGPSMFTDEKRKKLLALIRTYFKKGGGQVQINATSRDILFDAMEHPENYQNLVVRVAGFCAFYVTLDKGVQLDILDRTEHQ